MIKMIHRTNRHKLKGIAFSLGIGLALLTTTVFLFISAGTVHADVAPTDISIVVPGVTGNDLIFLDHNGWCGTTNGPDALWLPIEVTNNHGTETASGLELTLSLPLELSNQDPVRYIGTLGPGESKDVFFFVDYSSLRTIPGCTNIPTYVEPYTLTIVSLDGGITGSGVREVNRTFEAEGIQEANAGGEVNGQVLGEGIGVGQVFTHVVTYTLQNQNNKPAYFLPTGNNDFYEACFRLIGSEVLSTFDVNSGITVGTTDQLFFGNVNTGNNASLQMEYIWLATCGDSSTVTVPFAAQVSGSPWKYNDTNFADPSTAFPIPQPVSGQISLEKTVQVPPSFIFNPSPNSTVDVTYTITINNNYTHDLKLDRVYDQLDPNMAFIDETAISAIDNTNSSVFPATNDTGLLEWFGIPDSTSYIIPGQGSVDLVYQVTITYDGSILTPHTFVNTVTGTVGSDEIGPVTSTVTISPTGILSVGLDSFGIDGRANNMAWLSLGLVFFGLALTAVYLRRSKYQAD